MRRILSVSLDAAIAAVILFPIFLLLNRKYYHSRRKTTCYFLFAVYLSAVFAVVGLPTVNYIRFKPYFNLVPFAYMFSDYENSLLNVVLFLPMGFFLPVFWKFYRNLHITLAFGFCASLLIEVLQIFTFRTTDVNDLMTNTLGTLMGWIIARLFLRLSPGVCSSWKTRDLYVICGLTFAVMFFIHPVFTDFFYLFIF